MLIYVATAFFVCLTGCTWAQYYGSQPPQYSPQQHQQNQQQNSEAWRRWYYQQRQQEQQAGYNSARARQPSPVSSPAANSRYSNQRQPQQVSGISSQYSQPQYQQYNQQRQQQQYPQRQPSGGYNQQQGYAQSQQSYSGYQQPNYRPQPPPVTPPPLTTPAVPVEVEFEMEVPTTTTTPRPRPSYNQWGQYKYGAAFGGGVGSSPGVQGADLNSLVSLLNSPAAQSYLGTSRSAGLGGSNVYTGIGATELRNSPGLATAVQLLSRYNQVRPSPYNVHNAFPNSANSLQDRARLQYALSQRRLPQQLMNGQNAGISLLGKTTVKHTLVPPTTTPKAPPVVTEFEYEGPTTTTTPAPILPANVIPKTNSMGGASAPRQQAIPQTPWVNSNPQPFVHSSKTGQSSGYNPKRYPFRSMTGAPAGYVHIDTIRTELMTAIQSLNNEIAKMANITEVPSTTASSRINIAQRSDVVYSKKLNFLPGNLSFLLGKFASKLPAKISANNAQVNTHKIPIITGNELTRTIPQKQQPRTDWTGAFDLTPEQAQQLSTSSWSQVLSSQGSFPRHQPPQPQQLLLTTLPPPFQQNHRHVYDHSALPQVQPQQQQPPPPHDFTRQNPDPSWHRPPPEQLPRSQAASNNQNPHYLNPIVQRSPVNQQRDIYMSQPQLLDTPPQPSWQPAPSHNQPPVDSQRNYQQPTPQDMPLPPSGHSWKEPSSPHSQSSPNSQLSPSFPSNNQPQRHQNEAPYEQLQYQPQHQQRQQSLDINPAPTSQPQNEPLLHDLPRQHQQPGQQNHPQESLPLPFHQQPPPHQFLQEPPPQPFHQQPQNQPFPQEPPLQPFPQQHPPQNFPQEPPPQNFPQEPPPQNFPQEPPPQNFPQEPPPQQYQQEPPMQHYQPPPLPTQNQQTPPVDLQWPPQNVHNQQPPPQDFVQPPPGSSWEPQTSSPFDTYQQNQPNQPFYQEPPPLQPQRPPPLDISNFGPPNYTPPPRLDPAPQFTPAQNIYDPTPPVDFGNMNSVTYTSPVYQNYGSGGQYGNQYQPQPLPSSTYQQGQYQPQGQQNSYGNSNSNYYQQQVTQPDLSIQQQQYGQSSWGQPPHQIASGGQYTALDPTDPFSSKIDAAGLKPTVFNTQYPNQQGPSQGGGEFAGLFGEQNSQRPNPGAPPGKVDFGTKGPNPIQLNQFLAQPTPPKDMNALDALLGNLLSGTVAVQNGQKASSKPTPTTTKSPPAPPASSLVSDRLNGFVLGPKSEYRSNKFSEIPVNNAAYDHLNPLAGFMGETPPAPLTTTPIPPGRNGDFLEGFIGVNKMQNSPKPTRENVQPNIYIYNQMNDAPPLTTPPPPTPPAINDQSLSNMGTQDLSAIVQKLLGALADKQGVAQNQG